MALCLFDSTWLRGLRTLHLRDIYAGDQPAISIEFFPPKTPQGEANLESRLPRIKQLGPAFCSVTYGAAGTTRDKTLWWVKHLKNEHGFEVMCHLTCVGQSRAEVESILCELWDAGVRNIIALRGDPPAGCSEWTPHPEGFHYALELVGAAKRCGDFSIAVAGFPEGHPEAGTQQHGMMRLKEKVDAGADAIITQLFLDNEDYYRFVADARKAGITVPIVPGILPFKSVAQVRKFTTVYARTLSGEAKVPKILAQRLDLVADDDEAAARLGIEYATEQVTDLLKNDVPGIHFYCLNESQAVEAILRNIGTLRPAI
jgi:methylenetetrahydrofolate reductase (NADPH)